MHLVLDLNMRKTFEHDKEIILWRIWRMDYIYEKFTDENRYERSVRGNWHDILFL